MTRRQLSHHRRQLRRQRIIFFGGVGIIAAVVIIVLLGWFLGTYRPAHANVVTVGDRKFDASYVVDYISVLGKDQSNAQISQMMSVYINGLVQNTLTQQEAAKLGFTVSDDEVRGDLALLDLPENEATLDIFRAQRLIAVLKSQYFTEQVPASQPQVHVKAMLVESGMVGQEVRSRLEQGEDFAALVDEFAVDYVARNTNQGDYGWHIQSILEQEIGSTIPAEYAFDEMGAGDISPPLYDAEKQKQLGYWLINIDQKFTEDEFQVFALYLSSEQEALEIRQRLEDGEDMAALAEEYSQNEKSQTNRGDMGLIVRPDSEDTIRVSKAFDTYVFGEERETGVWSQPVRDDVLWTPGGYWIVQVVDRDDDRELSDEDYDSLLSSAYSDWINGLLEEHADDIDQTGLTPDVQRYILDKVFAGL